MKRVFDLITSTILFLILIPLMALLAISVRLSMGPPVVYRQVRPGLRGRPFSLYKFRTMVPQGDGQVVPAKDKERITPLGRWMRRYSMDELPQLFNVIRGDLSLVGPRPLLMEYLPKYTAEQGRRHDVRPGITGWAQVNGRNLLTWEEKFALDVWYVDNQTFWLDLKILFLTVLKVFRAEGIDRSGDTTMSGFGEEK